MTLSPPLSTHSDAQVLASLPNKLQFAAASTQPCRREANPKFELPQDVIEFVYSYDAANQLSTMEKKVTAGATLFTTTFGHDWDGNMVTRERDDTNVTVSYGWDDFNKLISVSSANSVGPTTDAKQESLYGVSGFHLTDALGSVTDIVRGTDGAVLQSYEYSENGEKTAR